MDRRGDGRAVREAAPRGLAREAPLSYEDVDAEGPARAGPLALSPAYTPVEAGGCPVTIDALRGGAEVDPYPIVVGYDGSASAFAALRWAADESVRHSAPLRLVYAARRTNRTAPAPTPASAFADPPADDADRDPESVIARGVDGAVARGADSTRVSGVVVDGPPAAVLCDQSAPARMLVLGSSGFAGRLVGSVSVAAAALARCPVVVVRDDDRFETPDGSIAVGVDESPEAQLAIGFAFEEAAVRSVGLTAVRVWTPPLPGWWGDVNQHILHTAKRATAERTVLQTALHGWTDKYPDVPVTVGLMAGDTGPALTLLARDAQLVVVSSHRHSGLRRQPGSVSRHLLHYATCPVALVREVSSLNATPPTVR